MDAACGRKIMQKRILDILQNTQKVIIGKERVTKLLLTALLADGHVLLEDVPGTGKQDLPKHWLPVSELNSKNSVYTGYASGGYHRLTYL